jgi:N-acyl-D-amino-acid deacylase
MLLASGCARHITAHPAAAPAGKNVQTTFHIDQENIPLVVPTDGDISSLHLSSRLPMTGETQNAMKPFDQHLSELLVRWQIPGAAVAIAKHGKLLFARGYGWSNIFNKEAVQPNSLCRIASVSKAITAVGVLQLCQDGKITLSTRPIPILAYPPIPEQRDRDPRLKDITVRQLLEFTGGWDRDHSQDAMFIPAVGQAAEMLSPTLRPTPDVVIRYALTKPLDFDPGSRFVYSNLEYAILGRLIAKVSGESYSQYATSKILQPMGIEGMRLGRTLVTAEGEMTYYPYPGEEKARSIFPNYNKPVPLPYGGDFAIEANEADAGWIASAPELAKFMCCLFGDRGPSLLSARWMKEMLARPDLEIWKGQRIYFAKGFEIEETQSPLGTVVSRRGSFAGSMAYMGRCDDGTTIAYVVNSRPKNSEVFERQMMSLIWHTAHEVHLDEGIDLFPKYH